MLLDLPISNQLKFFYFIYFVKQQTNKEAKIFKPV